MSSVFRDRNFEKVGGLQEHIQTLKEMILYPLLYRELFDSYGIQAPRGVLFYGPPGTGKTLMAGAVAAEVSKCCSRKVSFYMRKGGECLNKYVGESEKHLQSLFSQIKQISGLQYKAFYNFFDEIDGLVPTRSELQEQVHASVVTTLLALMDGLDTKSEVFVIGATNRIDMIDPALRRPGRFDRELYFPLPSLESRFEIFKIHTSNWKHKPADHLILKLAAECSGFCGADIQSLCSQAVMQSFNRCFPQVLDTTRKQQISLLNIVVKDEDFWGAKDKVVPASQRIYILPSRPLSSELEPLLKRSLDECIKEISKLCPFSFMYRNSEDFLKSKSLSCPRFMLLGKEGQAHISHLAPAILHFFDHLPVIVMDITTINEDVNKISDSNSLVHKIEEARQSMPSIIYLRNVLSWWNLIEDTAKQVVISSLQNLDACGNSKIFIFASASGSYSELPSEMKEIFPKKKCFEISEPTLEERKNFFAKLWWKKTYSLLAHQKVSNKNGQKDLTVSSLLDMEQFSNGLSRPKKRKLDFKNQYIDSKLFSKCKLRNFVSPKMGRLRNGKTYQQTCDDIGLPSGKKIKLELMESASCSGNDFESRKRENQNFIINVNKLEKLLNSAVEATAKARVTSMVRLYEELEIVSLRYSTKRDRSLLPEELENEISIFSPT